MIRNYKYLWLSKYIHLLTSGISALVTLVVGSLAIVNATSSSYGFSSTFSTHLTLGLIGFSLVVLQIVLGIINFLFIYLIPQKSYFIHNFKIVHRILGFLLTFLDYILLYTGFYIQFNSELWMSIVTNVFSLILIIFYEVRQISIRNEKVVSFQEKYNNLFKNSLLVVADYKAIKNYDKNKKLVLVYNFVCDVTEFINHHPGGKDNIIKNINSDITRFLIGNVNSLNNFVPFKHSNDIIYFIIKNYAISKLNLKYCPLVKENDNQAGADQTSFDLYSTEAFIVNDIFFKHSEEEIYKNFYQFTFKTHSNQHIFFANGLPGYSHLGKHYVLSSVTTKISRMYSICFMLNKIIKNKHYCLVNYCLSINDTTKIELDEEVINTTIDKNGLYSNELVLNMKIYENNQNAFSNYVHSSSHIFNDFLVNGPIGIGLNLPTNLEGNFILFSNGTGILSFLDFIGYIIRYICYCRLSIDVPEDYQIYKNEDFSNVKSSFKLIVYSSFSDRQSAILHDLIQKAVAIDKKHNLNKIEFVERISNENKEKWTESFITNEMKKYKSNEIKRIYVSGTPGFINEVDNGVSSTSFEHKEKLRFV